ncbi:Small G protein signaling modulator 1 [Aphelenchoides besseyi]|nr:Small G protein signaling modulator 1 [Aphelenchoides besseyi]
MSAGYRDPTADELVQRFRIASTSSLTSAPPKRPSLTIVKRGSSVIRAADAQVAVACTLSRNCVSSLHQNVRGSLLYGKNNVAVTTADGAETLKGYLSLHQESNRLLTVKWMPNILMHSCSQPASGPGSPIKQDSVDNSQIWKHTIIINLNSIIYIHLHQQGENNPILLVFVDAEGVQHRPFQFPPGQHCIAFLACLESGLSSMHHRLDPPLWHEPGKGKVLPQLKKRRSSLLRKSTDSTENDLNSPEKHDYVFRIRKLNGQVFTLPPVAAALSGFVAQNGFKNSAHSNSLPNSPALIKKVNENPIAKPQKETARPVVKANTTDVNNLSECDSLMDACESMRQQILSRAFYGWRQITYVRTHLACTVNSQRLKPNNDTAPVDEKFWRKCRQQKTTEIHQEFLIRCYFHGIEHELRRDVWPYLLQLIPWKEEVGDYLDNWRHLYVAETRIWGEIETEVIKRDCEQFKNARLRQSSNIEEYRSPPMRDESINSDVFVDSNSPTENGTETKSQRELLIEEFGTNLHRIEKDVERCDRHTSFFSSRENLDSLKRIMCTYVWRHLVDGYVQGMCDIAGPLLVIFEDEVLTLECFEVLMERMKHNFPLGNGIENNLNNLRSIVQVMDTEVYQQIMNDTDCTHLYFAYRWFLLDFKRELTYPDVFLVWEVIWAARQTVSSQFQLFFAFALLFQYREVILENNMDFTDVIKFFNERAEKHEARELLSIAREKLLSMQELTDSTPSAENESSNAFHS